MITKLQALQSLLPDVQVIMVDDEISQWLDDRPQPTDEEIAAKVIELQAEYDAKDWERNRLKEYPSLQDCIHALLDGGDTLTDLQAARQLVKDTYPKPGE